MVVDIFEILGEEDDIQFEVFDCGCDTLWIMKFVGHQEVIIHVVVPSYKLIELVDCVLFGLQ